MKLIDHKNVIVLGINTAGVHVNSINNYFYLRNSKIEIGFGNRIYKKFDKYYGEGNGYYPDIWLDLSNENIMESIIKFIKK